MVELLVFIFNPPNFIVIDNTIISRNNSVNYWYININIETDDNEQPISEFVVIH
jgi:hypothetical protein